jgi:hypothetical protein
MLVLDSVGHPDFQQTEAFLDLPKEVIVENKKFELAYITLHCVDHFTSLHHFKQKWFYYDGKILGGKITPATKSNWENKIPFNAVYFAS